MENDTDPEICIDTCKRIEHIHRTCIKNIEICIVDRVGIQDRRAAAENSKVCYTEPKGYDCNQIDIKGREGVEGIQAGSGAENEVIKVQGRSSEGTKAVSIKVADSNKPEHQWINGEGTKATNAESTKSTQTNKEKNAETKAVLTNKKTNAESTQTSKETNAERAADHTQTKKEANIETKAEVRTPEERPRKSTRTTTAESTQKRKTKSAKTKAKSRAPGLGDKGAERPQREDTEVRDTERSRTERKAKSTGEGSQESRDCQGRGTERSHRALMAPHRKSTGAEGGNLAPVNLSKKFREEEDVMEIDSPAQSLKRLLEERAKNQNKGAPHGKRTREPAK